jgi:pyranose oxidase
LAKHSKRYKGRFQILPQHLAVKLKQNGHRIEYVKVKDLTDLTSKRIYADTFIVAGGSFLTPRLLWQSKIRYYALGRYLNENPVAGCRVYLGEEIQKALRDNPENPARERAIPVPLYDPEPMLGYDSTEEKPWHAQIHRAGRFRTYDPAADARLIVDFIWFGMVDPNPDNRITFSEIYTDRFGMPQISIEYRLSDSDQKKADEMKEDLETTAMAIGDFTKPSVGVAPLILPAGSSLHLQGTYRMGDDALQDEKTSVVDTYSKVWGIDNLYLGGLGIIPTKMASNPTLTACAFAIRSVSQILGQSAAELGRELETLETE